MTQKTNAGPWKVRGGHVYTCLRGSDDYVIPVYVLGKNAKLIESAQTILNLLNEYVQAHNSAPSTVASDFFPPDQVCEQAEALIKGLSEFVVTADPESHGPRIGSLTDGQLAEYMGREATAEDAAKFRKLLDQDKSPSDYSDSEWGGKLDLITKFFW